MRTSATDAERRSSCLRLADWWEVPVADGKRQSDRFDKSAALADSFSLVREKSRRILIAASSSPRPPSEKLMGHCAGSCHDFPVCQRSILSHRGSLDLSFLLHNGDNDA